MIISCPHCQTRYQVTYEAIGAAGRKVQCAHCHKDWQENAPDPAARLEDDALFDSLSEDGLDEAMAAEEHAVTAEVATLLALEEEKHAAVSAPPDSAQIRLRQRAFARRRKLLRRDQPVARMRRSVRMLVYGALALILAGAWFGRVAIVTHFPALAGLYEAVGLQVNVLGLDFADVETLRSLRDGREYLTVSATIAGLSARPVNVPSVLVTLTDSAGSAIYQWSVTPPVHTLIAGERVNVETQLAMPPAEAKGVRLTFGDRGGEPAAGAAANRDTEEGTP
jgi:predicted Zn finger-like uncharacterized protein